MKTVYVTRRERFNAAHKLWNADWSAEKNHQVFGKCANENWHGHNYDLFVTVKGEPHPDTGFCVDLKDLSDLVKERITDKLDHKNLNLDVPFMKGIMASTENLCIAIWEELEESIEKMGCKLHSIKLHETENNFAEYFGES
jgi:6-pyruvoyltetrahydropterin/6-carboxytetrahydropterin synthase